MLKTISAALLAASVLVVTPAMAHGPDRTHIPQYGTVHVNPVVRDSNARMGRHHYRHRHHGRHLHRHFRHHDRFHWHR